MSADMVIGVCADMVISVCDKNNNNIYINLVKKYKIYINIIYVFFIGSGEAYAASSHPDFFSPPPLLV